MAILNYSTKIRADRTVSEIQKMLATKGAHRVAIDYRDGDISAVMFALDVGSEEVHFRLPSNPGGVLAVLQKQRVQRQFQTMEHAHSVSWRIVKDWIAAQLALVEAGQAQMAEVFMPYAVMKGGQTMFQLFEERSGRMLAGDVLE